jgi:hypothetical protein
LAISATFVTISLIVWGFATLRWYVPIGLFLAGHLLAAVTVTRSNWTVWMPFSVLLQAVALAGGLYLWIWHWPFR